MEDERYLYALLAATVGCTVTILALVGIMFYWFNPDGPDCSFNVTAIAASVVVALVLPAASMHPRVGPDRTLDLCVLAACHG